MVNKKIGLDQTSPMTVCAAWRMRLNIVCFLVIK